MKSKSPTLIIFFIVVSSLAAPVCLAQTRATVAAWNLGGFEPIPPQRVDRLARVIRRMDPDVIALTEVNPAASVLQRLDDQLTAMGRDYSFIFFEENAFQNIALLFKDGVQVTDQELIPGSDDNNSDLRKALAAKVRLRNFDFILITVHMKSARSNADRAIRTRQATAIANYIRSETSGNERDVLVVGDYNMIPGDDQVNFSAMSPGPNNNEFLRFVSTERFTGQTSHISACNPLRGNLLDGYAISRAHTREFLDIRMLTLTDPIFELPNNQRRCTNYKGFISDHFPMIARFRINRPDDD